MTTEHTPEPWEIEYEEFHPEWPVRIGPVWVEWVDEHLCGLERIKADAALIHAAPRLLDAGEALLKRLAAQWPDDHSDEVVNLRDAVTQARKPPVPISEEVSDA